MENRKELIKQWLENLKPNEFGNYIVKDNLGNKFNLVILIDDALEQIYKDDE